MNEADKEKFRSGQCVCLSDALEYDPDWYDILLHTSFRHVSPDDPTADIYYLDDNFMRDIVQVPANQWSECVSELCGFPVEFTRMTGIKMKPQGYCKPHTDPFFDISGVLYLNKHWNNNWGGELRFEKQRNDWEHITFPKAGYSTFFLNPSYDTGPRHEVALISADAPVRIAIGINWAAKRKPIYDSLPNEESHASHLVLGGKEIHVHGDTLSLEDL